MLSLLGLFQYSHWLAAVGAIGVILAACYLLWMFQRTMFNDRGDDAVKPAFKLREIGLREIASLVPLVVFVIWVGVYPAASCSSCTCPCKTSSRGSDPPCTGVHAGGLAQLVHVTRGLF